MGKQIDVLADLRSVVRIARAASVGVTGNEPRIAAAERAIAGVAELIAAATEIRDTAWGPGKTDQPHIIRLDAALSTLSEGC
jgi:hypothetical protein